MAAPDGRTDRKLTGAAWLAGGPLPRLLGVLDRDGEEARVVGGAVRNTLLGMTPHEIDVATTAVPEEVVRRVEAAGFKAVPTGIAHGTITVVIDSQPFEVTTLRQDVETYGRHAKVAFGRDWRADAERRDFTINAFSARVRRHGLRLCRWARRSCRAPRALHRRSQAAHRGRLPAHPALLPLPRRLRHQSDHPDRAGLEACIAGRAGLDQLSRERVRMELMKLVVAPHAVPTLIAMTDAGLTLRVLGGVSYLASFEMMAKVEAAIGMSPDPVQRLGALAVWVAEDAERLWQKLRLTNAEHERLASMAAGWRRISPAYGEQAARALLYRLGPQHFTDHVLLAWARSSVGMIDAAWRELATLPARWTAPAFPLKAADFMARGVDKGPMLGVVIREAEDAWVRAGFPQDAAALAKIADQAAKGG